MPSYKAYSLQSPIKMLVTSCSFNLFQDFVKINGFNFNLEKKIIFWGEHIYYHQFPE